MKVDDVENFCLKVSIVWLSNIQGETKLNVPMTKCINGYSSTLENF